jgi:hypothetical protein
LGCPKKFDPFYGSIIFNPPSLLFPDALLVDGVKLILSSTAITIKVGQKFCSIASVKGFLSFFVNFPKIFEKKP